MTDVILPRIPSDLIKLALVDLVKCERSKKYTIHMGVWYEPDYCGNGGCAVCLAGTVMAQSLGDGPVDLGPENFPKNEGQLAALDTLRVGDMAQTEGYLNIEPSKLEPFERSITVYNHDPGRFKREMRKLARDLREAGY